ncbi:MAG: anti-sigma factor antagonist [Actinomycetota bacterium]|jgi:anti-anti-sigma factor|nr:anti-sigma factor antagonist [Actinomycetota bacterium]
MNPGELELNVVSLDGHGVVHLVGELDLASAGKLRRTLHDLYQDGIRSLVLDLSRLGFVDSTGLSEFVTALKYCRQRGGDVVLRSPTPSTAKVLAICGLDQVFTID